MRQIPLLCSLSAAAIHLYLCPDAARHTAPSHTLNHALVATTRQQLHQRELLQGRQLEETGVALAAVLRRLLLSRTRDGAALDLESLCIIPGKAVWRLSVDCIVFAAGGGLVDALALAVRAALADTAVPTVRVDQGIEDATADDIEVDPDASAVLRLDVSNLPIIVTACQVPPLTPVGCASAAAVAAPSLRADAVWVPPCQSPPASTAHGVVRMPRRWAPASLTRYSCGPHASTECRVGHGQLPGCVSNATVGWGVLRAVCCPAVNPSSPPDTVTFTFVSQADGSGSWQRCRCPGPYVP